MSLFVTLKGKHWCWIDPREGDLQQGQWEALVRVLRARREQTWALIPVSDPQWQREVQQLQSRLRSLGWKAIVPQREEDLTGQDYVWMLPPAWFEKKARAIRRRLARKQRGGEA